jgi:hypothetical protein
MIITISFYFLGGATIGKSTTNWKDFDFDWLTNIFLNFIQQIFYKQLIWDMSIYIFFKMSIFYVTLNKDKSPCNKKKWFL